MSIFSLFGDGGAGLCELELELDRRNKAPLTRAEMLAAQAVETAIEFICGKPGGGKSMYATRMIVDELRFGHRFVVTNLALNLGRLQEYLDELGAKVNVIDRVRLIDDSEVVEFYLLGPLGVRVEPRSVVEGGCDWSPFRNDERTAGGIMYVIDECHNFFHPQAACLKGFSPEHPMFQAASQHRKLKERWLFVTQSVENVHVAIRRLAQQFNYIRNLRKEKFRGFRRGNGFLRTVYLSVPTSTSAVAIDEDKFSLDVKGLASCYDTAGGVGIKKHGAADGGAAIKGLHLNWIYGVAGVSLVAVLGVLLVAPKYAIAATLRSTIGGTALDPKAKAAGSSVHSVAVGVGSAVDTPSRVYGTVSGAMLVGNQLKIAVYGRGWLSVVTPLQGVPAALLLSDGTVVRLADVRSGGGVGDLVKAEAARAAGQARIQGASGRPSSAEVPL